MDQQFDKKIKTKVDYTDTKAESIVLVKLNYYNK